MSFIVMLMPATDRRDQLLELIRLRGFAALPDLASKLGVSESTIRRDLDHLEENGSTKRTHGGVFYTGPKPKLKHFDRIQSQNFSEKQQIAHFAAKMIDDGETILLDGGSTAYELARLLLGRNLQVITNSLPIANLFVGNEATDLVMIGGYVHSKTGVSLGPFAIEMLKDLNCQKAFLSVSGLHQEGLYNSNLLIVETERAMMQSAEQVIVLADHAKFGRKSLSKLCELSEAGTIIVDDGISMDWQKRVREAEVDLQVAPKLGNESRIIR
jgi:DeoR family fructose operon transcriptional repressor